MGDDLDMDEAGLRAELESCDPDDRLGVMTDLALALAVRADAGGPGAGRDREEAVELLGGVLEELLPGDEETVRVAAVRGQLLAMVALPAGDPERVAEAIAGLEGGVAVVPPDDPLRAASLYWLFFCLLARDGDRPPLETLGRLAALSGELVGLMPRDDPDRTEMIARHAGVLAYRLEHHGVAPGGDGLPLGVLAEAYASLEPGPSRRDVARSLAALHAARAPLPYGPSPERDAAAGWLRAAIEEPAPASAELHAYLGHLLIRGMMPAETPADLGALGFAEACALGARLRGNGPPGALAEATRHLTRAAELAPGDPAVLGLLSMARMLGAESPSGVAEALAGVRATAENLPPEDPRAAMAAATAALMSVETDPEPPGGEALDRRIDELREVTAASAAGHPLRPVLSGRLGEALARRGELSGRVDDCAEAVGALLDALAAMEGDHPLRTSCARALSRAVLAVARLDPAHLDLERVVPALPEIFEPPSGPFPLDEARTCYLFGAVYGIGSVRLADTTYFERSISRFNRAIELTPEDSPDRKWLLYLAAGILLDGYSRDRDLQYLDAALHYYDRIGRLDHDLAEPALAMGRGLARYLRSMHETGEENAEAGIADLERALSLVPDGLPYQESITAGLDAMRLSRGKEAPGPADLAALLRVLAAAEAADPRLIPGRDMVMDLTRGYTMIGMSGAAPGRGSLDEGIALVEGVVRRLEEVPGHTSEAFAFNALAEGYHARGDLARAVDAALRAVRARLTGVMLQTGTGRVLAMSKQVADEAFRAARWALATGRPATAVEALELARGMTLHAATSSAGLPALLRQAGQESLADEWERHPAGGPDGGDLSPWDLPAKGARDASPGGAGEEAGGRPYGTEAGDPPGAVREGEGEVPTVRIPDDLRRRAVLALARADPAGLLDPPGVDEIAAALAATGADALVYLLPASEHGPGLALLVLPGGRIAELPLPALSSMGAVASYAAAHRELLAALRGGEAPERARERWRAALAAVCAWAWTAVMEPVLARVTAYGATPGIVLVPWGGLAAVPWHAAGLPGRDGGPGRQACEEAVVSYAASARQFATVASREPAAYGEAPVIVSDPAGPRLRWGRRECEEIARLFYPDAQLLGRWRKGGFRAEDAGEATPGALLGRMPGTGHPASMLHLGCHAESSASAAESTLLLRGEGGRLTVDLILRQARDGSRDAPGPLVVLSACTSDLAEDDHDESLTLSTALLAAGASGVVGSRWAIDDDPRTALMMVMFHHFLRDRGERPAQALRRAQAWMVDPGRKAPGAVSAELLLLAGQRDLADPAIWAAFTHQGA